jgi:enediyne biosynthesis protein E4
MITRRNLIITMAGAAGTALTSALETAFGQGTSSRGVKAQPRGKPSGRPFLARFTDVAMQAGLKQPIIYGAVD